MAEAAQTPGTPIAPARRRWAVRCTAVLAASLPLLTVVAPQSPAVAAAPSAPAALSVPTADESRTASVSITGLTPSAPGKGDTVTVSGRVSNRTSSDIAEARVALRPGARLTTRSAIDRADSRTPYVPGVDGEEIGGKATVKIGDLPSGAGFSFTLSVPADKLPFDEPGVYQLGVSLSGRMNGEPYGRVLGIERAVLPWQPSTPEQATQLTFLWPLISSTHVTARTESGDRRRMPVFEDDDLEAEIAPGGRLQQMVALGSKLPVTWVVDPDLLASVEAMTNNYKVLTEDGREVAGKGQADARRWLHELRQAVEDGEVVALPFGDPDLASLAHRGKKISGALSHLGPATELGRMTVETTLLTEPSTDFAWPVEGAVDPSIVSVATSAGAHNVIARSDSMREPASLNHTPTAARPIGGGTTAIVADARLSKLFQGDMTRADDSTRAVQRFLAHTQSITAQQPGRQRSIVVAPQRMPTVSQAQVMADALDTLQLDGRWAEFVSLTEASEADPDPRAGREVPRRDSYPASLHKRELRTESFEEIRAIRNTLDDFKSILSEPARVETPFNSALHRSMSVSWRGDREAAAEYRDSVGGYLEELTGGVRLVEKSDMKLSGRSATIPVTVQNKLLQDVENLELRLVSGRRIGLDVGEAQPVTVEGGHSQSVKVPTTAKANGRTWVEARLYTEDGEPWGKAMRFQVEVTEITSAVMLVISGGVLLVVLAGVRMYTQRKRIGEQPDPDAPLVRHTDGPEERGDADSGGEPAGEARDGDGAGAGDGQTGDPAGNTGAGRRDPSGTGEKVER
ncbi:hypothetical protein IQ279_06565 [Streptomyces verrucosisporus]|uniref:DUF6049 family protein n=1 Tax=Streptomyces verrucosisporus TaxID=1695161 RepID=UPI0019D2B5EB|nr:DUF6049 family protein [Streptomyces verrucosisporus]MBN3929305.1 hypothetical protein [Streptomyces verrucosisporus]